MRGRNTMQATTRNSLAVVAAGTAAGLVVWAVVRLLGVDLTVESGSGATQVDVVDVLVTTLVAGLAAWGASPCCCAGAGPLVAVRRQHGPGHLHHRAELPGRRHLRRLPDLHAHRRRGGPDHGVHAPGAEPVRHRRRDRRPAVAPWLTRCCRASGSGSSAASATASSASPTTTSSCPSSASSGRGWSGSTSTGRRSSPSPAAGASTPWT